MIGTVYLNVADSEKLATFYQDIIGLQVHHREENRVHLGTGGDDLLVLIHQPTYKRYANTAGLYHFAILVPSRQDLALVLQHLIDTRTPLQGLSDHAVSEAIYLADPEGNGIEIYRDRPRSDWYRGGEFQLTTYRMDVEGVLGELKGAAWSGLPAGTVMGHIHLHVSSVPEAEAFYHDTLGMDVMMNMGSATFMSYDGYHHHLGANVWGGRHKAPADSLGLHHFDLHVPHNVQTDGDAVTDPSGNRIVVL